MAPNDERSESLSPQGEGSPTKSNPKGSREGLAPARECWVLLNPKGEAIAADNSSEPVDETFYPKQDGFEWVRMVEAPVSPSLEAPKPEEASEEAEVPCRGCKGTGHYDGSAHTSCGGTGRRPAHVYADAPAVQGAPTEAGLAPHDDPANTDYQSDSAPAFRFDAKRGEGGEKKPTPEAGAGPDGTWPIPAGHTKCHKCRGSGGSDDFNCPNCLGKGYVRSVEPEAGGAQDGEGLPEIFEGYDSAMAQYERSPDGPIRTEKWAAVLAERGKLAARLRSLPLSEGPKERTADEFPGHTEDCVRRWGFACNCGKWQREEGRKGAGA